MTKTLGTTIRNVINDITGNNFTFKNKKVAAILETPVDSIEWHGEECWVMDKPVMKMKRGHMSEVENRLIVKKLSPEAAAKNGAEYLVVLS